VNILIDMAGAGLVILNVWLGIRYGLLRRLLAFAGLYAGIAVAAFAGNAVAGWFYSSPQPKSLYANAWAFIIVAALVTVGIETLGALYDEKLNAIMSLVFDRSTAAATGVLLGFCEIAVVCMVGLSAGGAQQPNQLSPLPNDRASVADSVRASIVGGRVNGMLTQLNRIFQPVMPDDLAAHLADSSKVDLPQQAGAGH
jgi:uncharacterized membrane protein required for colicin V production